MKSRKSKVESPGNHENEVSAASDFGLSTFHFRLHSRLHPIDLLPDSAAKIWLKRDDETGMAIPGGKRRKYASLIPWLVKAGFKEAILIGGANSNNVVGLSQLLIENGIRPIPLLKESRSGSGSVNAFLLELLVPKNEWRWLSAEDWLRVEAIASEMATERAAKGQACFVVPEGAFCAPALAGAMTVGEEIAEHEGELGLQFDHIFIEAGTGMSAAGMIYSLAERKTPAVVHVLLLAMEANEFEERLKVIGKWYEEEKKNRIAFTQLNFIPHRPSTARSFGSVNSEVVAAIKGYASKFGLLTDPVYSAKLLLESEKIIRDRQIAGNVLIFHSGGAHVLPGFEALIRNKGQD